MPLTWELNTSAAWSHLAWPCLSTVLAQLLTKTFSRDAALCWLGGCLSAEAAAIQLLAMAHQSLSTGMHRRPWYHSKAHLSREGHSLLGKAGMGGNPCGLTCGNCSAHFSQRDRTSRHKRTIACCRRWGSSCGVRMRRTPHGAAQPAATACRSAGTIWRRRARHPSCMRRARRRARPGCR